MSVTSSRAQDSGPKKYYVVPPGLYQAVLYGAWDLGQTEKVWQGVRKFVRQMGLGFELDHVITEGPLQGKNALISKSYTNSLSDKSNIYKDLTTWLGRPLTPEELGLFRWETMVGVNCTLAIANIDKREGGKMAVINSINPITDSMRKNLLIATQPAEPAPKWVHRVREKNAAIMAEADMAPGADIPF